MDDRTRKGLLVGYHVQPGGLWSGDYLVVDWEILQQHPDATPGQCRIHRVSDIFCDVAKFEFPLAEYRKIEERVVKLPRDVRAESPKQKPAYAPGQIDPPGDVSGPPQGEANASGLDWVGLFGAGPQDDMRGKGEVLPHGRTVRPWKGSKRPPGIDPDVWARLFTTCLLYTSDAADE